MLKHGGRLLEAAQNYQIPVSDWLDLSTGINPNGYPVPKIPDAVWLRLPENLDGLIAAAQQYYQCTSLLPVAGSQAAIQALPQLRKAAVVGLVTPSYAEHAHAWQRAGHSIVSLSVNDIDLYINQLDCLVLVNPNNPSACQFSQAQCLAWLAVLQKKKGWLIVDEAFIDCLPELSLSAYAPLKGLIILRSIGKFFGLAGIRAGFVLAEADILNQLNELLGPWALSNPTRFVTACALQDKQWQDDTRVQLQHDSERLARLLCAYQLVPMGSTALFQWVAVVNAAEIHYLLAKQAVFTRLFAQPASLRFGLPANESEWAHLTSALQTLSFKGK
ncbi:MAG: threonine-phosphate decarboxylase CobD [Methyloprofundus sp.]|nr:threonine-phosphate decarboxylase CobD [Methyloprofundus sp.]MDT8425034.1 threonine-phosphate decarboxylase CobD [Methyloprofundus sp.]